MGARIVSWVAKNAPLSESEMLNNAELAYRALRNLKWTKESVTAVIANMEAESRINPGAWEGYNYGNMSGGYGLCQWTPATKYINWAGDNWENNGLRQIERLQYESTRGGEFWVKRHEDQSWTWEKFKSYTGDVALLAEVFCWNFEGPWVVIYGSESEKQALREYRSNLALKWLQYANSWEATPLQRRRMPIWMMCRRVT